MSTIKFPVNGLKCQNSVYHYHQESTSTALKQRARADAREGKEVIKMKIILDFVRQRVTVVILLVLCLVAAVAVSPAEAAFRTSSMTISCDSVTEAQGVTVYHRFGAFGIRQHTSNPTSSSYVYAVTHGGEGLDPQMVSDGQQAVWRSIRPGSYTVKAFRATSANCNGVGFGHGNYRIRYTVGYTS